MERESGQHDRSERVAGMRVRFILGTSGTLLKILGSQKSQVVESTGFVMLKEWGGRVAITLRVKGALFVSKLIE